MAAPAARLVPAGISVSHPLFIMGDMATQLVLLDSPPPSWKLDRRTREVGRRGVAEARAALRKAGNGSTTSPSRAQAA